jgi:methanogenic corrinoid protein MtbC1
MQASMRLLEPEIKRRGETAKRAGTVVIGTVHGDIHEIGKSLVGIMLTANGFVVHDLGVDVPPAKFVATARDTGAQIIVSRVAPRRWSSSARSSRPSRPKACVRRCG